MPIRPALPVQVAEDASPLPRPRSTALCSSEASTPSSAITFATSARSDERNAKTPEMQFVTCSFSRSPAFCETRISAVFAGPAHPRDLGHSLAPSGVEVIAHASSRKMAFGSRRSIPFSSRRANCETRYSSATDSRCS